MRRFFRSLPQGAVLEWFSQDDLDTHPAGVLAEVRCREVEAAIRWSPAWTIVSARAPNLRVATSLTNLVDERGDWSNADMQELLEHWVRSAMGRTDIRLRRIETPADTELPATWNGVVQMADEWNAAVREALDDAPEQITVDDLIARLTAMVRKHFGEDADLEATLRRMGTDLPTVLGNDGCD